MVDVINSCRAGPLKALQRGSTQYVDGAQSLLKDPVM